MGDIRTTRGDPPPAPLPERRRKAAVVAFSVLLVLAAIVAAGAFIRVPKRVSAAGYATTPGYAEVRSAVGGRVAEILVRSGDAVTNGAVLLRLEDEAERAAIATGEGTLAKAEAELALREAQRREELRLHTESVRQAELDLRQAESRVELTKQLHDKGLASGRKLQDDEFSKEKAEARLQALQGADLTVGEKQPEVLRAEIRTRRDALDAARVALAQREVRAPIAGRAVRYTFYVGEMIRPDMILYELFDGETTLLKVRVPEKYASRVALGMGLDVRAATVGGLLPRRFPGRVEALRDVVEGTGDAHYRVAYCSFEHLGEEIPPGASVEARILLGRVRLWEFLLRP